MSDLVQRLQEAAVAAIEAERADLERQPHRLRGLVLDIRLRVNGNSGPTISEATCYVERKALLPRGERE